MSLDDSLSHVRNLLEIKTDDDALVDAGPSFMLKVESINEVSSVDINAYISDRFMYHNEEMRLISRLNTNLKDGEMFITMLYTYRGVAKAIPQSKEQQDSEIDEKTFDVLLPEIQKMKQLLSFSEKSVKLVSEVVQSISEARKKEKNFCSESFLIALAKNFNMFLVLDALKNMKGCLTNDHSLYKRALSKLKRVDQSRKDETEENQKLNFFLASRDSFSINLKTSMNNAEEILADLLDLCADLIEEGHYLDPENKHTLIKALAFGIYLVDQDKTVPEKNIVLKNKKAIERYSKIIKSTPIVPLMGDVYTTLDVILKGAKHLEESKWSYDKNDESLKKSYNLVHSLSDSKEQFRSFLSDCSVTLNETRQMENASNNSKVIYDIGLRGLKLASLLTSKILEQISWKFDNRTDPYHNNKCPEDATDYEKVVRYNYSNQERFALIEYIAMVKSLNQTLIKLDAEFGEIIKKNIHMETQKFAHIQLQEIHAHVLKKKKSVATLVAHVKDLLLDLADGIEATSSAEISKKKKGKTETNLSLDSMPHRSVGISESQLAYVRSLLDSSFNERAQGMQGGFMKDKDFNSEEVEQMKKFYWDSFYFPFMQSFGDSVAKCCDLSQLWYKEFYLELSKEIQFPIEMSLPWILTDHILSSETAPEMTEYILFPLDLYNDAANRALFKFKTQYLYDEIEAEVNLAFDQFLFKLSTNIFTHYKILASNHMLNKAQKQEMEARMGQNENKFEPSRNRYEAILKQRHFQLLGRSIDLAKLIAQRVLDNIRRSIEIAIMRYEASDFTKILELDYLIENNRITHSLLSKHLPLGSFNELLAEIDDDSSLTTSSSRILAHTIAEFTADLIPNYSFNSVTQRFIISPLPMGDQIQRPNMPKGQPYHQFGARNYNNAFSNFFEAHKSYVGEIHFSSLLNLLSDRKLAVMSGELQRVAETLFKETLIPYVQALSKGMPQSSKLPLFLYKTNGTYEYFYVKLKPLLTYRDLKTGVFQAFREIGNVVYISLMLDQSFTKQKILSTVQYAPFLGLTNYENDPIPAEIRVLKDVLAVNKEILANSGTRLDFATLGQQIDDYYRAPLSKFSITKSVIQFFDRLLDSVRGEWKGAVPTNNVIEADYCIEFYRVWSAIQFSYCTPSFNDKEFTSRELCGEGLQLAGCLIIHLLEQVSRFNLFDFSYHVLNVSVMEKDPLGTTSGMDLNKFVELTTFFKSINDDIFSLLDTIYPKKSGKMGVFEPPTAENPEGSYIPFTGEHGTAKPLVTEKKLNLQTIN